jgi:hypothetical protein
MGVSRVKVGDGMAREIKYQSTIPEWISDVEKWG